MDAAKLKEAQSERRPKRRITQLEGAAAQAEEQRQLEAGHRIIDRYRNMFRTLASK